MKDIFLLDMDETLLDFPRAERVNFFRALAAFGVAADGRMYGRFHEINDGLWKQLERGALSREELKVLRFALLFGETGVAACAEDVARAYYDGFPELCFPYAGAKELLETLARRGRVYIVTNGGANIQRRHIELAGFAPYLAGAFISEEVGADKPAQAFADRVAAQIEEYRGKRALYLGDSLTSDMPCARRMGADFVLYAPNGAPQGYAGSVAANYAEFLRIAGITPDEK